MMLKRDKPSEYFCGAILRAYDRAKAERERDPTPSALWDYIVMECLQGRDRFTAMFQWDTSKAKSVNRIGTIMECLERGYVPGLRLGEDERGRKVVMPL